MKKGRLEAVKWLPQNPFTASHLPTFMFNSLSERAPRSSDVDVVA